MDLQKAKILDSILLKFEGNKTLTWKSLQDGLLNDIASYYVIENNINFLIGDGMLKRNLDLQSLSLSDKGFGTMTDLKNLGYAIKTKKEKKDNTWKYILAALSIITFLLVSIRFYKDYIVKKGEEISTVSEKITEKRIKDSLVLKESFHEEDFVTEYLKERLKPIRENFKRINSITKWTSKEEKDIWETTEGGDATFYYLADSLEKIITHYYGETFQILIEYYLLNGQLSFVFEKSYKYNRPIYYDSLAMKDNKDDQTFDFTESEIVEDRNYFENGKLIHQLSNQDCGSPFSDDYLLEEQKRIKTDFDKLIKLTTKKVN